MNWERLRTRTRLASGLILFAYVLSHLLNHAAGLVSYEALLAGGNRFLWFWRLPPVQFLLYGALAAHVANALYALATLRAPRGLGALEIFRLLSGFALPPLLILHVLGTVGVAPFGVRTGYGPVLMSIWVLKPHLAWLQSIALVLAWAHGCVGLHVWLRFRDGYRRLRPALGGAALLIPVVSLCGFVTAGHEIDHLVQSQAFLDGLRDRLGPNIDQASAWAVAAQERGFVLMAAALGLVLAFRLGSEWRRRRLGQIVIHYPEGRRALIAGGTVTVLEASRLAGVPHAAICGGRGRCSTCRVRIDEGLESLAAPGPEEAKVLARIGAPPGIRLACQIRPTADLRLAPLLPATIEPDAALVDAARAAGRERRIAVLFADLRGFTGLAESRLPFDVVYLLNRYFRAMTQAIEQAGGRVDKFLGDGIMALFGDGTAEQADAAAAALRAAAAMLEALDRLNEELRPDLDQPLRMGIGLHYGRAIVGVMGYGPAAGATAIGDTVNTASRLETATKEFGVAVIASNALTEAAGFACEGMRREVIQLRGRGTAVPAVLLEPERLKAWATTTAEGKES